MALADPEHVLHVEDDDPDADLVAHLLRNRPYRLSRVRTYGEMMSFTGRPDVVLLDLRIPGSNDPIRLVQDAVRCFRGAGIILLTGVGDAAGEELSVRAMAAGAQLRLLKQTFDGRRLHLSICEAYQQRQHMMRMLEQSRTDMGLDDLREVIRSVIAEGGLDQRIRNVDQNMTSALQKLRKLGAEDTIPITLPHDHDQRWAGDLIFFVKRHQKAIQWILMSIAAAYFALGDYVNGIREAVFDTRERVKKIEEHLDDQ